MDTEVLKSYLVSLGFDVNQPQLRKFDGALREAFGLVEANSLGMAKSLLKVQASVASAFSAVSTGIVAMADHVAGADQKYRLLGLRMFMTQEAARKLQVGLDAVGASLDEIAWDPELRSRFLQLSEDQDRLAQGLGANFARDMRGIRDLRFEFTRLKVALEYLSMRFVSSIFRAFGTDIQGAQDKLRALTTWIEERLPAAGDQLAAQFVPVLQTTWQVISEIGEALGETALLFANFIGLLTGDTSIQGTTLDFQKLGGAIQHVVGWLGTVMHWLVSAEKMLVHFADAAVLALSGKFADAQAELHKGFQELGPGAGAIAGAVVGGAIGSIVPGAGTGIGASIGMGLGAALGGVNKELHPGDDHVALDIAAPALPQQQMLFPPSTPTPRDWQPVDEPGASHSPAAAALSPVQLDTGPIAALVAQTARQHGVDPRLAQAVAKQESGQRQYDKHGDVISSGKALGVMQLTPATARDLQVDPRDTKQNVEGGVSYLEQLLKRYHQDIPKALAAYNMGPNGLDRAIARHRSLPLETTNYVRSIMGKMGAGGQTVTIGDVHISITQPHASPEQVYAEAKRGMTDALRKQTTRNVAQLGWVG